MNLAYLYIYIYIERESFKRVFETMKGGFRSLSMKGLRSSRSLRVVQDSVVIVENIKPSIWETMPYELLRDVLMRIEDSDNTWPERKNVVACGGVCRIWREIVREIVKTTEVSAKLTFPISLKQPGPRDSLIHCYIKRNRSTQTFYLYLSLNEASNDNGKFLLAARKFRHATCTDYVISINSRDFSKGSSSYIGKLRSNFLGSKFTVYDAQSPNAGVKVNKCGSTKLVGVKQVSPKVPPGNYPVVHISYELNVLGSRGPRRMSCVMDAIPASSILAGGIAPTQTEFVTITNAVDPFPSLPFLRSKSSRVNLLKSNTLSSPQQINKTLVMKNKLPRWHEQLQCWCLNFNGRVTVASVKNFQLVGSGDDIENENVIVQFGKVGKDVFTMDYMYPISAFQAFAICLSSFDTKIACE